MFGVTRAGQVGVTRAGQVGATSVPHPCTLSLHPVYTVPHTAYMHRAVYRSGYVRTRYGEHLGSVLQHLRCNSVVFELRTGTNEHLLWARTGSLRGPGVRLGNDWLQPGWCSEGVRRLKLFLEVGRLLTFVKVKGAIPLVLGATVKRRKGWIDTCRLNEGNGSGRMDSFVRLAESDIPAVSPRSVLKVLKVSMLFGAQDACSLARCTSPFLVVIGRCSPFGLVRTSHFQNKTDRK